MKNFNGINLRYIYSACVVTTTADVSILHDPWFTEGIYDGAWYHYPTVHDPLTSIGNVDYIYISHIHPDHYDSRFILSYFERYGVKKVFIANHKPNHLAGKMRADGIEATILNEPLSIGNTEIRIIPHQTGSISDIDSAIIIKYKEKDKTHCLVNANDIIFDDEFQNFLKEVAGSVDILLCGYTGAGPYPQTYFDSKDPQLALEAEFKKMTFFDRYKTLTNKIQAKVNIPFAGKYLLGGKLSRLNSFRGVADPTEILEIDQNAIVLSDNGGEINTKDFIPTSIRTKKYNDIDVNLHIDTIKDYKMDYEKLISNDEVNQLPLRRLLISAAKNAISKSECDDDYYFCFKLPNQKYAVINANRNACDPIIFIDDSFNLPSPRSEILIDPRYLFGLLTNVYHWNNAEVGSQFEVRRVPNIFNRKVQSFLNFLAI